MSVNQVGRGWGETYVVSRRNGDTIFEWMPAHVKNLLVEIDLISISLFPHPTTLASASPSWAASSRATLLSPVRTCCIDGSGHSHFLGFEGRFVGLKNDLGFLLRVGGVNHEVVVVASCHDIATVSTEDDFKLIKDAVVLVGVAQTRAQMFMNGNSLDGLPFHVDIPYLDRQIVS